jgi:uncharacterized membrane protein
MIKRLRETHRLNETIFLAISSITCFAVSVLRFMYTDSKLFLFLNWNLFLAFIPWALTSLSVIKPNLRKNGLVITVLIPTWLLFFPNAPYIVTDLFHLRLNSTMPIWFDLVLILCFAWTGLLFGFLSLWDIEDLISSFVEQKWIITISCGLLFIGSFGIYIGRYLRWNSWDIIIEPFDLLYDIGDKIIYPLHHPGAWGMTIFMGIFLNMMYWSLRLIRTRNK